MKKNRVFIVILLLVLSYGRVSIYKSQIKDMRNRKYDETSSIDVSLLNNKIEPRGYRYGFDFEYSELPVIEVEDNERFLFFKLADDSVDEIIVGEDYYAGNTCYKETYTLNKTTEGKFQLPIKRNDTIKGNHATYYLKYNLEDEGVFVFRSEFL